MAWTFPCNVTGLSGTYISLCWWWVFLPLWSLLSLLFLIYMFCVGGGLRGGSFSLELCLHVCLCCPISQCFCLSFSVVVGGGGIPPLWFVFRLDVLFCLSLALIHYFFLRLRVVWIIISCGLSSSLSLWLCLPVLLPCRKDNEEGTQGQIER